MSLHLDSRQRAASVARQHSNRPTLRVKYMNDFKYVVSGFRRTYRGKNNQAEEDAWNSARAQRCT